MSKHNVYPEYQDRVVARWIKTTIHPVAGVRLDPHAKEKRASFVLRTREDDYNFDERKVNFVYESEVLELYSEEEARVFSALNRPLIESGAIVPYIEKAPETDTTNALSDEQVIELATISNLPKFRSKIEELTSLTTLRRVLAEIPETRSMAFYKVVQGRISELEKRP